MSLITIAEAREVYLRYIKEHPNEERDKWIDIGAYKVRSYFLYQLFCDDNGKRRLAGVLKRKGLDDTTPFKRIAMATWKIDGEENKKGFTLVLHPDFQVKDFQPKEITDYSDQLRYIYGS